MKKFLEFTTVGLVIGVVLGCAYAVMSENVPVALGFGILPLLVGMVLGIVNRSKR